MQVIRRACIFFILIFLDQLTKYLVQQIFLNYFFAFGLNIPKVLMYGIYVIGIIFVFFQMKNSFKKNMHLESWAWLVILAGALSNTIERLILGFVRDWIFILNGVFNLADGYIILGIAGLLLSSKFKYKNSENI